MGSAGTGPEAKLKLVDASKANGISREVRRPIKVSRERD
jgi:hypothetical protein